MTLRQGSTWSPAILLTFDLPQQGSLGGNSLGLFFLLSCLVFVTVS